MLNYHYSKYFKIYILLFISAFYASSVYTQWTCTFDEVHSHLLLKDSQYRKNIRLLDEQIYNYSKSYYGSRINTRSKPTYILPLVIHIIAPPGTIIGQGNNLTNQQVEQGLSYLNQAFANQGPFTSAEGVDVGIQFCLARRDPNGQPTNGITRNYSNLVNEIMCNPGTNSASDNAIKSLVNWDCRQYINIWLVTDLFNANFGCSLAGYAYFPGAPCSVDGIVQESRYWNSVGGTTITAHEMGHYLSLHHTFNGGCVNNNCLLDGDQVCDTPPDNSPSFANCNINSCNTDSPDLPDDNTNFMDYTSCGPGHFTDGQRVRMIAALETSRSSLIQSKGCLQLGNYDVSMIDIVTGDLCKDSFCVRIQFRNEGLVPFTSLNINYSIDGIPQSAILWSGNLNTNETTSIILPCFVISPGLHTLIVSLGNPDNQTDFFPANNTMSIDFQTYSKLRLSLDKVTPTHCVTDGTVLVSAAGGTAPYVFSISSQSYTQTSPFFQLLISGSQRVTVRDSIGCTQSLDVSIPDSCKIIRNDSFIVNRDAFSLGNDCYSLTRAFTFQSGSVWYQQKADLSKSFDVYFDINLGCLDAPGADGIAFVLQPISTSIGVAGGGLGYQGIRPSLAVEFDTWQNSNFADPAFDHVSIMRNGNVDHASADNLAGPVGIFSNMSNAEDCNFHKVLIRWNAATQTIFVYINCDLRLRYSGDIVRSIFNTNPQVFFGFTAATGSAVNNQQVCFNYVSTVNKLQDYTICKGSSVQISAVNRFEKYRWFPSIGINDSSIFNPVFSPDTTRIYYLEQTDICGFTYLDSFTIHVIDQKINYTLSLLDSCQSFTGAELRIFSNADTSKRYSLDGITFTKDTIFQIRQPGLYTLYIKSGLCIIPELIQVSEFRHPLRDSIIRIEALNCKDSGRLIIAALDGIPPYEYRINNGAWQTDGIFEKLLPGNYLIEIRDQTSCNINRTVFVNEFKNTIFLKTDSSQLNLSCCNPNTYISVNATGSIPYYYYSLDNKAWTSTGLFSNILPGKHKILARDEFGCTSDSLDFEVIDQMIQSQDTQKLQICTGTFIKVGNDQYSSTGIYTNQFQNRFCCDSIIITDLIVHPQFAINNPQTICQGEEILVGTKKYSVAGNYVDTLQSIHSCDSVVLTNLMLNPVYTKDQFPVICDGEHIRVANNIYTQSGNYIDSLQTIRGCDSIINTFLTVRPVHAQTQNHNLCKGQFVIVAAKKYQQTGIYVDTLINQYGCDSVITTNLFIDTLAADILIDSILCYQDDNGRISIHPKNGIPEFTYSINDPLNFSRQNVFEPLSPGNYILYLKDSLSCVESFPVTLYQALQLMSDLDAEIKIQLGQKIIFNPLLNFNPVKIQWIPETGLSCTDCLHPEVQPLGNIEYDVIFTNEYDCETNARVKIIVDNQTEIYVPNAFSPNGDQINDWVTVFGGESIAEVLVFRIYNRWGEVVFENQNFAINDLQAGWDGSMNGQKMNPGVFVYYAKARRIDGSEIVKVGDLSLIR
jgi:gliding motility-associated-like protein